MPEAAVQSNKPANVSYIYALCRDDGRVFYIGKGLGNRWTDHVRQARAGDRSYKAAIIRDMLARGVEMPMVKLHEGLTEAVALDYEVALIKAIGRYPNGPLANLTNGGEGLAGYKPPPETRAKLSAAGLGRKQSAEHVAKRTGWNRGKKATDEARAKLSASCLGRKKSPEARAKQSATMRSRRSPKYLAKLAAATERREQRLIAAATPNKTKRRSLRPREAVGHKQSAEHIAKRTASAREARERRGSLVGRKLSPDHIAKAVAGKLAAKERRRAEAIALAAIT